MVDLRRPEDLIAELRSRDVGAEPVPYLFIEATPLSAQSGVATTSLGVIVIRGTTAAGGLEIISVAGGDVADAGFWEGVFVDLFRRDLHGTRLVISPDLPELRAVVANLIPEAEWQRSDEPSTSVAWARWTAG